MADRAVDILVPGHGVLNCVSTKPYQGVVVCARRDSSLGMGRNGTGFDTGTNGDDVQQPRNISEGDPCTRLHRPHSLVFGCVLRVSAHYFGPLLVYIRPLKKSSLDPVLLASLVHQDSQQGRLRQHKR